VSDLPPFVPFGGQHLAALTAVALVAGFVVQLARAGPRAGLALRLALAVGIAGFLAWELAVAAREGWLTWKTLLPLELCDAALVLAVLTLVWPRRPLAELLYFWGTSGTVLAMLTPELSYGFPRWEFVVFFALHGLVFAAALLLVFGLGLRPRPGAPLRAFLVTAAWAALAGAVNLALGTNFMYLRAKPGVPTLLDHMGPWPLYILAGAAVAFVLFHLLGLPFRTRVPSGRPLE
jgi:hypothetical integral membrane protein (TIGR02206 family)